MTEEELEQKAEEYAKKKLETIGNFLIPDDLAEIYIDGYKQGQKENERLKKALQDVLDVLNNFV